MARQVVAGVPLHVTQRGNRGQPTFFDDSDRLFYLALLHHYTRRHDVEVLAYCLMPNHVHLVLVPGAAENLHRALKPLHSRHAQRVHRARDWRGHLWQGRFFSSMLDDSYLWAAIRYVERNPVRARMIARAEDYPWSSARTHCGIGDDPLISAGSAWSRHLAAMNDWSRWLAIAEDSSQLENLRRGVNQGRPCGSPEFVAKLEAATGHCLRPGINGRPRKDASTAARAIVTASP
jgi:putative transposase